MNKHGRSVQPEVWGGLECTITRKQDKFVDQLELAGHYDRPGDLEAFAQLNIKAIRYPVLWEKHVSETNEPTRQWDWTSRQLNFLREKSINPIIGLVHHGSGPAFTSLLDERFPALLAGYAHEVATKFPWISHYTPVNEPLTTARFAGLYGHWYPHHTTEQSFLTMLLNQVEGVVRSMEAIRKINPAAKLIQTEDLGYTHSTKKIGYQADFENLRRWLSYDLLCGKVNQEHPLYGYIINNGISPERLDFFIEKPCAPDIAGFNYYVTSERYLDSRLKRYPSCLHGSNGREFYVDTEAARQVRLLGIGKLLTQAWDRYHIPLAVTEAHLHCSREDQVRWFKEIWDSCYKLNTKGIPVLAVTAWSLLGAYDWDSLLVKDAGNYQVGVFEIINNRLRPTAMVSMIQSLGANGQYNHPLLANKGWWHRHNPRYKDACRSNKKGPVSPLLIVGAGTLGYEFEKACEDRGICALCLSTDDIDITDQDSIEHIIKTHQPWGIINTTGHLEVDQPETEIARCFAINAIAPGLLAAACHQHHISFATFAGEPPHTNSYQYPRAAVSNTWSFNGSRKADADTWLITHYPKSLIIKTETAHVNTELNGIAYPVMRAVDEYDSAKPVEENTGFDQLPTLVHVALDLFIDGAAGIWHLTKEGKLKSGEFVNGSAMAPVRNGSTATPVAGSTGAGVAQPVCDVPESKRKQLPSLLNAMDHYFIEKVV